MRTERTREHLEDPDPFIGPLGEGFMLDLDQIPMPHANVSHGVLGRYGYLPRTKEFRSNALGVSFPMNGKVALALQPAHQLPKGLRFFDGRARALGFHPHQHLFARSFRSILRYSKQGLSVGNERSRRTSPHREGETICQSSGWR